MTAHPPFHPSVTQVAGRLAGRRILVTGAASGIGRSTAELFVQAGAQVAGLDQKRPEKLAGVDDSQFLACEADITDPEAVERAVRNAVEAFGGLDGVVNAAGIGSSEFADAISLENWKKLIDVNLTGTFTVCRATVSHLREAGGGTIVNVSC